MPPMRRYFIDKVRFLRSNIRVREKKVRNFCQSDSIIVIMNRIYEVLVLNLLHISGRFLTLQLA